MRYGNKVRAEDIIIIFLFIFLLVAFYFVRHLSLLCGYWLRPPWIKSNKFRFANAIWVTCAVNLKQYTSEEFSYVCVCHRVSTINHNRSNENMYLVNFQITNEICYFRLYCGQIILPTVHTFCVCGRILLSDRKNWNVDNNCILIFRAFHLNVCVWAAYGAESFAFGTNS